VIAADSGPATEGVNVAEILHDELAAKLLPQVLLDAKSGALVPATTMLVMLSGLFPEFVTVTD